ncbi:5-dehydro-2-deoxygluconokinase [uncultured Ruegeria sp.]|uniref:5-dehydro-2-deoxygluconokinase n=1 Tax=uncultured Ruegeria sp. TaxID=259304 RepID=UPI002603550B|nr:5-dehydro-2-deoxygluconokinase [uncultured Ruegeria sp.]
MNALTDGIRGNRFAILGRAGMDLFADPIGIKSEDADTFQADLGGSSANIGAGLVKLGSQASLITSISDDAIGRFCLKRLQYYGVDTSHIRVVGGEHRMSVAIYESRTEDFQNVIYRNGAVDFQVTEEDMDRVDFSAFSAVLSAGTVFASEPSRSATFRGFEHARKAGLPIIFDIDYRPYSWPSPEVAADVLSRAGEASDLIVGNDEEFGFMAGGLDKGFAKAQELAEKPGRIVIYKMGEKGAVTLADGQEIKTGIYPVDAIKPVGAGDSFMAGLLASIAAGHSLKDSVMRGSACASIVVSKPGCAPAMPTTTQLDAFLSNHPGPTT